ncbi:phospholipid carrier-dependent glycosyltransferase [Roseovarius sp. A21]|uniref:Phospholipid carrier-dependent glycosyltransferase n=1 Tax=Roseovarius bejariae TaxID=2576383 RepID=A0A844CW78_9RHOB|nr:glycosyltransferase family 39 protein [Roseovarius bejariae]MRU14920.1 phospholipid carrier-dependent glycosyltransferase [Roseovarius bejariae]
MMPRPDRFYILVGFTLLMVSGVLLRPMMPIDETRYLSVAWEMRLGDHWLVPFKNGTPYDHKPPLLFWLMNLVWLPGVSETAARLVAPAFSVATLWATGRVSDAMGLGRDTGTAAMLILTTGAAFLFYGGETGFDTMLALSVVLAVWQLWRIAQDQTFKTGQWALFGAALALGVMSKGPVVFVHVLPPLAGLWLWAPRTPRVVPGVAVALAACIGLVGLWLLPALVLGGADYREAVLWTQTAGRTVSSFAHAHPVWYYLPLLPVLLFPWGWLPGFWKRLPLDAPERLLWIATLGPLLIFSLISGKQLHYLVPQLPWIAILLARRWPDRIRHGWIPASILIVLAIAFCLLAFGVAGDEAALLLTWPIAITVAIPLLAVAGVIALRPGLTMLAGPAAITALHLCYTLGPAGDIMSPARLAQRLAPADGHIAMISSVYHADFHFAGRLQHPFKLLTTPEDIERFAKSDPKGVILGQPERAPMPSWPPAETIYYRNENWALWSTKDKP